MSIVINPFWSGGGGGSFVPSDVLDLFLLDDSGASAGTWADTVNSNDFTQATGANQPTIIANELNGHQVRRFDGSNDRLAASIANTGTAFSVAAVVKINNAGGAPRVIGTSVNGGGANDYDGATYCIPILGLSGTVGGYRNGGALSGYSYTNGTWAILISVFDGTNHTLYVDGVAQTSVASSGSFGIGFAAIGSNTSSSDSGSYLSGDIATIGATLSALSSGDATSLTSYWQSRYAL